NESEEDRLSPTEIALLTSWIEQGAAWEPGFTFAINNYEPPLRPRQPTLPPAAGGREHPVDRIVDAYFAENQILRPSNLSDTAFLRRITLDLVGLLPTPEERIEFLSDASPHKRQKLIAKLLSNEIAYTEHWLSFWNDLLRNDYAGTGFITKGRKQISAWLYQSLIENKPYDQMVRQLITPDAESEGFIQGIRWRGVVNASQRQELQFAQNVSQAFLGINLKCASCHDSFIDRWTLEETYALAQVYATEPLELHRCDKPNGQYAKAAWLFPDLGQIDADASQDQRLQQLSQLLTTPENGRFSRTMANRIWHRLMGHGIVHPVDAMHTEPWNADLLDYLANYFVEHDYDLKQLIAHICESQIYQSVTPVSLKETSTEFVFTGPQTRRMTAEQFVDSVWQLTKGGPTKFDAPVSRVGTPQEDATTQIMAKGKWIWSTADPAVPGGEKRTFRHTFEIDELPDHFVAAITCDNEYKLFLNGKLVVQDNNWESVERANLLPHLRKGLNTLLVACTNGASSPNPAGLLFDAVLDLGGEQKVLASDASWEWCSFHPKKNGQFPVGMKIAWRPSVELPHQGVWAERVAQGRMEALSRFDGDQLMVRASLLKADELMRALGRPNRDQIVTMRPEALTTLEAIQLANGQRLADVLANGANGLVAQFADAPKELTPWLFEFALSRSPTNAELSLTDLILNQTSTQTEVQAANVEDLLWAILMLPEFQLIR
ncbi:MAG: DUF1549 domain-containing protein, partial [Planctomycetota bacterium]